MWVITQCMWVICIYMNMRWGGSLATLSLLFSLSRNYVRAALRFIRSGIKNDITLSMYGVDWVYAKTISNSKSERYYPLVGVWVIMAPLFNSTTLSLSLSLPVLGSLSIQWVWSNIFIIIIISFISLIFFWNIIIFKKEISNLYLCWCLWIIHWHTRKLVVTSNNNFSFVHSLHLIIINTTNTDKTRIIFTTKNSTFSPYRRHIKMKRYLYYTGTYENNNWNSIQSIRKWTISLYLNITSCGRRILLYVNEEENK